MKERIIDLINSLLIALDAKEFRDDIVVSVEKFPIKKDGNWEYQTFYQVLKTEDQYKELTDELISAFLYFYQKQYLLESESERQILRKSIEQTMQKFKFVTEKEVKESGNELYPKVFKLREQSIKELKNLISETPDTGIEENIEPLKNKIKWNGTANEFVAHFAPLITSRKLYLKAIDKGDTSPIVKILHNTFEIKKDIGDSEEIKVGTLETYFKNFNSSSIKK